MKILQIKINNLASLEGESQIDFTSEPLASAGIFAITGPTGAGKSTILDALCLALYARTPRYVQAGAKRGIELVDSSGDTISQGDPRAILRDGTASGSASVTFIGADGDRYEATWAVRRARLQITGKLAGYTHTLFNATKQKDIPGTRTTIHKEIERLVGLNFDQFTRSVLLAQGDFTAFMKADKEEKSALLEKLTGSQIYSEISQKIYEHYKAEEEVLKKLQAKAENIDLLTAQQIDFIEQEILSRQKEQKAHLAEKAVIDSAILWHRQKADLETKSQGASQVHTTALTNWAALSEIRQQLEQVQLVRPLKSTQESLLENKTALETLYGQQKSLTIKLQELNEAKARAIAEHGTLFEEQKNKDQALKNARPLLIKAGNLDTQINSASAQLGDLNAKLAQAGQQKDDLQKDKDTIQTKLEAGEASLKAAVDWTIQRQDRSKIAEHTELITSRLTEAAGLLERCHDHAARIDNLAKVTEQLNEKWQVCNTRLNQTSQHHQENQSLLQQMQQKSKQTAIELLDKQLEEAQSKDRALDKTQDLFEQLERARSDYASADGKRIENTQRLEQLTATSDNLQPKVKAQQTQVETIQDLIYKATLRNAENIEQLRAGLTTGAPCPVCGSTEHPYASKAHEDLAAQLIDGLKEELEIAQQQFAATNQQFADITSERTIRQREQPILEKTLKEKSAVYQNAQNQWDAMPFSVDLKGKESTDIVQWLSAQINANKKALALLQNQKSEARNLLKEQERLQSAADTEKEALQGLKDEIKELESEIRLKSLDLSSGKTALQETEDKLQAIRNALHGYFPTADWFSNWQAAPDKFAEAIVKFSHDWKAKKEQAEGLKLLVTQATTELSGFDRQLENAIKHVTSQQEAVNQQRQLFNGLMEQRKNIFDGKPVLEIENALQETFEIAVSAVETSKTKLEELEKRWAETHYQKEALETSVQQAELKYQQLDHKITDWTNQYNAANKNAPLTRTAVESLLAFNDQWIADNQQKTAQAERQVQDAKSRLEERKQDLQNHLLTTSDPRALEQLLKLQSDGEAALEQLSKLILQEQLKIDNNQKNLKKQGSIQKEIDTQQTVFDGWAALNSLIGSRDGRRFREIAQQYTLDLLLQYANKHLHILSRRYVLSRIRDSLSIQVIDQDMADEIRSVYSLSGGESFLVSLALALGLSSLSSHRLKVESLFIDEGFGSLDPSTLSIAMDALERLQDQGRKVGVISHVQEMTERISVQIRVHKKPNGKSSISIESMA